MTHFKPFDGLEDHAILGCDPGKSSGVALWVPSIDHRAIYASAELPRERITEWAHTKLEAAFTDTMTPVKLCLIAVEQFAQARGGQPLTNQPDALRVIETMRNLADELHCSLTTNQASAAKKLANNQRMRRIGWYKATKNGHETDARREILITISRFHKDLYRDIIREENEHDATR